MPKAVQGSLWRRLKWWKVWDGLCLWYFDHRYGRWIPLSIAAHWGYGLLPAKRLWKKILLLSCRITCTWMNVGNYTHMHIWTTQTPYASSIMLMVGAHIHKKPFMKLPRVCYSARSYNTDTCIFAKDRYLVSQKSWCLVHYRINPSINFHEWFHNVDKGLDMNTSRKQELYHRFE